MIDANHLDWTETHAKAETVALNGWNSPVSPEAAFAHKVGPKALAVEVHLSDGRWCVMCPDCNGAQIACPDDRRFMCNECANVVADGLWRPVVWPANRAAIEKLVAMRPQKAQNWLPGETVAFLRTENIDRGVA